MSAGTVIAFVLALASTTLASLAYLREHDAAASMPALSMRRPLHSVALLLTDRGWLLGFAMEGGGFLLYASALALAPLALVQSIAAGGIGLLAFFSMRLGGGQLGSRHLLGAVPLRARARRAGRLAGERQRRRRPQRLDASP